MDIEPPRNPQEMFDLIVRTMEQLRDAPMRMPHGYTDEDPHLFHPLEGRFYHRYCAACGLPREYLPPGAATADLITLAEVLEVPPIRPETIDAMMATAREIRLRDYWLAPYRLGIEPPRGPWLAGPFGAPVPREG